MSLPILNHHPIKPDGLVLWLDSKNTGSVAATGTWEDYSGNGYDGVCQLDAYVNSAGAQLDGTDDYIACGTGPSAIAGDITVMALINSGAALSRSMFIAGDRKATSDKNGWEFFVQNTASGEKLVFQADSGASGGYRIGSTGVADGVWHHVAGVRLGNTFHVYVDGSLDDSGSSIDLAGDISSTSITCVGRSPSSNDCFLGLIDGVMIFSRALSAGEIKQHYLRNLRA